MIKKTMHGVIFNSRDFLCLFFLLRFFRREGGEQANIFPGLFGL